MTTINGIVVAPDPILSAVSEPIEDPSSADVRALAEQMAEAMYSAGGCGIAAPQVGENVRLIVVDCQWAQSGAKDPIVMVNPEIAFASDEQVDGKEGCLSVPGVDVMVKRANDVTARYEDLDDESREISAYGLLARCIQHEIDHLDGLTILDKPRGPKRIQAIGAYRMATKNGAVPGCDPMFLV